MKRMSEIEEDIKDATDQIKIKKVLLVRLINTVTVTGLPLKFQS